MWMRWGLGAGVRSGGEGGIAVGDRRIGWGMRSGQRGVRKCWEGRVRRSPYCSLHRAEGRTEMRSPEKQQLRSDSIGMLETYERYTV